MTLTKVLPQDLLNDIVPAGQDKPMVWASEYYGTNASGDFGFFPVSWWVQRMVTRQTLTPTTIVTANPLVPNLINASWMDYYISTASFSSTVPTWWNSLFDFAWDCQYDFTMPNHGWSINWFITGTWITYRWPHDDWYTKDVNVVLWSIHGKAESSVQAPWTWLSLSVNIYHWVDTWIALLMAWWWISFWPYFSTAITFYPTN